MKIEEVKQWQCGNGKAVAVNPCKQWERHPFNEKISYGAYDWKVFNQWASDPANQPVTDLSGIFNSEQVKEVWEWFNNRDTTPGQWVRVWDIHYLISFSEFYNYFSNFKTRRRLVLAESALCNTDSSPASQQYDIKIELVDEMEDVLKSKYNPDSLHVGETAEDIIEKLPFVKYDGSKRYLAIHVLSAMNKFAKQQLSEAGESKWIDVKDRLPEDGRFYLTCYSRDDYYSCETGQVYTRIDGSKCFVDRNESAINPTHWQPLPSAPNETNVSPRLYTHEQVLAFGEKVKELASENVRINIFDSETHNTELTQVIFFGTNRVTVDKQSILSLDIKGVIEKI